MGRRGEKVISNKYRDKCDRNGGERAIDQNVRHNEDCLPRFTNKPLKRTSTSSRQTFASLIGKELKTMIAWFSMSYIAYVGG
jgi:hypothetical protein